MKRSWIIATSFFFVALVKLVSMALNIEPGPKSHAADAGLIASAVNYMVAFVLLGRASKKSPQDVHNAALMLILLRMLLVFVWVGLAVYSNWFDLGYFIMLYLICFFAFIPLEVLYLKAARAEKPAGHTEQ